LVERDVSQRGTSLFNDIEQVLQDGHIGLASFGRGRLFDISAEHDMGDPADLSNTSSLNLLTHSGIFRNRIVPESYSALGYIPKHSLTDLAAHENLQKQYSSNSPKGFWLLSIR
jgi:hypothetical protein